MSRFLRFAPGLLLFLAFAASCGLPATQGGANRTHTSVALATTATSLMTSPPDATIVPSVTLTPPAATTEPTGTFAAGAMFVPTKTLHPEGYTFEDIDIRSDLTTLRPELNELQAPFATALRGTAEALGRFPSATPWPFPVTPNPTPILDSWIVEDPRTQATVAELYRDLLTFLASSGPVSIAEFSERLKDYMVSDENGPSSAMYCAYDDIVAKYSDLFRRNRYMTYSVPDIELIRPDIDAPLMQLSLHSSGHYYSFMEMKPRQGIEVEERDRITDEVVERKFYSTGLNWYFFPRLETDAVTETWRLYAAIVPIGCYP